MGVVEELKSDKKTAKNGAKGVFDKEMKDAEEEKKVEDDSHDTSGGKDNVRQTKPDAEKGEGLERKERAARKVANRFLKGFANN